MQQDQFVGLANTPPYTERSIRKIKGITDCPHLWPDNFAVSFSDPNFVRRIVSDIDELKHLLKSFGLLALTCYKEKVVLDFEPQNIYLNAKDPQLIKGVLKKGAGVEIQFEDWKLKLVNLYKLLFEKIKLVVSRTDYEDELSMLVSQLTMANNPEEVASYFRGWLYWNTYQRMP